MWGVLYTVDYDLAVAYCCGCCNFDVTLVCLCGALLAVGGLGGVMFVLGCAMIDGYLLIWFSVSLAVYGLWWID